MSRRNRVLTVTLLAWLGMLAVTRGLAGELPRYQLRPGMELVYRSADTPPADDLGDGKRTVVRHDYEWTLYSIRLNDDGTQRIVFRQRWTSRVYSPESGDQAYGEPSVLRDDGYFDLAPDGRIVENPTIHAFCNPTVLFPPLPPDRASLESGWGATLAFDGSQRKMRSEPLDSGNPEQWCISEQEVKLEHAVALTKRRRDYRFDLQKGLVTRAITTSEEGWSSIVRPAIPVELMSVKQCSPAELAVLAQDAETYYQSRSIADRLLDRASHELAATKQLLKEATSALTAGGKQLSSPFIKAMFADKLATYQEQSNRFLRREHDFGDLLNTPSEDWQTTDLDGKPHALHDYRGKVIVLDFWNRSCAWCIRAIPDLKKLADEFPVDDVAILGVSMDADEKDARFVADTAQLNYPTLKNGALGAGLDKNYLVRGNPTMVVLDGRGVIRHIHVGYSPTLREDLSKVLRELMAEQRMRQ
jgi:peroxiredoxin